MKITQALDKDLDEIHFLLQECKNHLLELGIFQWDSEYPSREHIVSDISKGSLRVLKVNCSIAGVVSFDQFQEPQYSNVAWQLTNGPISVIHRLAVSPRFQGRGFAKELMDYAESTISSQKYASIRLDAYSGNAQVVELYYRRGYKKAGEIFFPRRELPFICMERAAKT